MKQIYLKSLSTESKSEAFRPAFYYLQTRYYDPEVGRFLIADCHIGANGDIQGFNLFAYCSNNGISYSDSVGTRKVDNDLTPPKTIVPYEFFCGADFCTYEYHLIESHVFSKR